MKKSIIVAAIGFGVLALAGPAHAEESNGQAEAEVSSYALPPRAVPPVAQALPASPVVASAGQTAQVAPAGELPVTGSSTDGIMQIGAAALLTGGGLVVVAQQRNRKARRTL